jgi:hypothetical protein
MTTVRIAHAEPRPGKLSTGGFQTRGILVVLADTVLTEDGGHRAVPIWMRGDPGAGDLSQLLGSAHEIVTASAPQELTYRLLRAADASVTGVDIDVTTPNATELRPQDTVARIGLTGPAGTRQVTAALGLGLAMAAATGAPVRLPDAVVDRVAVPVRGDDLLTPFLDRVPRVARAPRGRPRQRPRYEPRNMEFADGLDRWDLDQRDDEDYSADVDGPCAILSSAVPRPVGSATLVQSIFADDYRGATVVFRAQIRAAPLTAQAGLRLEIFRHWWRTGRDPREDHGVTIPGGRAWAAHEVTALVTEDADMIGFGITLSGPGQVFLRHPEFRRAEPVDGAR